MSEDPYVYEGTDVLRNTADLRNPQILAQREQIVSFRALLQMQKEPVLGTFDLAHYAAIHKRLFGEIYPWAGETRTIETWKPEIVLQGKCVVYSPPAAIEGHARSALDRLRQPPGDLKQDRPTIVYAQAFAALWQAHPFREGNTRTLLAFMEQHARHHRQPLDQGLINRVPSETRDALVLATRGTIRPLAEMIQNARYAEEKWAASESMSPCSTAVPVSLRPAPSRMRISSSIARKCCHALRRVSASWVSRAPSIRVA